VTDPLVVHLHSAARRYLTEQHAAWCDRYTEMQRGRKPPIPYSYTDREYATFPRYNVLAAILTEVERIDPEEVTTLDEMRELLVTAGEAAESDFTRQSPGAAGREISLRAMDEEREVFVAHVRALDEDLLWRVAPLPRRFILPEARAARVRDDIARVWAIEGSFYPDTPARRHDVCAFHRRTFESEGAMRFVRDLAARRDGGAQPLLWWWENSGSVVEMELAALDFAGAEVFITSKALDWLIYASYEGSITVAGSILDGLLAAWPGAQAARW